MPHRNERAILKAGLSREEVLELAKSVAPQGVTVDVHESDEFFSLQLGLNFGVGSARCAIPRITYHKTNSKDQEDILQTIRETTKDRMSREIKRYCESFFGMVVKNSEFEDRLKRDDEIYSVNHHYEIQEALNFTHRYNLDYYYSIKAHADIPRHDTLWQRLVRDQFEHQYAQELFEYMHGALERYKHALFAKDIIAELLGESVDNDIVFLVNFHFYYFITVIKALGDNLAWVLNYFYKLGLQSSPHKIDLTKTSFQEKLKAAKESLYKKICQGPLYEKYRRLRDFRDIVIHRHALHVVTVQFGKEGPKKIMVPIDPSTGTMFDWSAEKTGRYVASSKESMAKYGLKQMVILLSQEGESRYDDLTEFCTTHLRYIATAYEQALKEILSATSASTKKFDSDEISESNFKHHVT